MNYLDYLLPIFKHYSVLAYSLVLFLSFLESVAFFGTIVPGTTFLVALGFLASQNFFHVSILFLLSMVGALSGDVLSFYLGRHSDKLFKPDSKIFKAVYLKKGQEFIKKYGSGGLVFGRFLGPMKAVVPFVAGMFKMKAKKFWFYEILSVLSWSVTFLFVGYFFGRAWQAVSIWSNRLSVVVFWLAVFLAVFYILKWLFIKKGKAVVEFLISLTASVGEGIKDNPDINNFFGRHPLLAGFLKKRFDRTKFSGLLLTILILISVCAVWSFVDTAIDIFVTGNGVNADLSLENLLHAFRNPLLVKIFLWVTLLGNWRIVAVMILIVLVLFWLWNKKNYIVPFLVSVGGGFLTGTLGKYLWHRPRPMGVAVYTESSWSFPSGHAILAVSLYGFLIYFYWKYFRKWKNKIDALFLGLLIIILIGFSRLYLGVHYLSDVWAGYLVGFLWLLVGAGLVESKNTILVAGEHKPKHLKIITAGLLCLLAVVYVGYGLRYKPLLNPGAEEEVVQKVENARVGEIFTDYKLPKFTETLLGNPQEPFSFIVVADNDAQLIKSFQQANWFLADGVNFNSLVTTFKFEVLNQPYPTAPMTPYFWRTYTNDYGFEEPTEVNSARYRHHARFWRTNFTTAAGKNIYVGITSLDMGVKWWGITHKINPDLDSEREYLFDVLNKVAVVGVYEKKQFVDPVLGQNFTGDQFFTDGKVYIMYLK